MSLSSDGNSNLPSRPARGGWIEIVLLSNGVDVLTSRPARGGWIEILEAISFEFAREVPPRTGRVD